VILDFILVHCTISFNFGYLDKHLINLELRIFYHIPFLRVSCYNNVNVFSNLEHKNNN